MNFLARKTQFSLVYSTTILYDDRYHIICDRICENPTQLHISISCLLNIYDLLSQVYPLAKCQPHMPITSAVTALQSSNNRKINLYSKHRENKLQALTKAVVNGLRYGAKLFTIVFAMNRGINYWVSFSFTHPSSLHTKMKFVKINCTIAST